MRECYEPSVLLPEEVSYDVFRSVLEFIYTGHLHVAAAVNNVAWLMDLLRAADQFCVDPVKRICEERVSTLVTAANAQDIFNEASRYQASYLVRYCQWVLRRPTAITEFSVKCLVNTGLCYNVFQYI